MNLDLRAASAAEDLLRRAARRPIPDIAELVRSPKHPSPRRLPLVAAAAVLVVALVAGLVLLRGGDSHKTAPAAEPVPVPAGVDPVPYAPAGLGVSMLVPSTWTPSASTVFDHGLTSPDGDAYVGTQRLVGMSHVDVSTVVADRAANLKQIVPDAIIEQPDGVQIDGHAAIVQHQTLPKGAAIAYPVVVTQYVIDLGDGTYALVVVGEKQPEDQQTLRAWLGSTLTVRPDPAFVTPTAHPTGEVAPPDGTTPQTFAPGDLGVTVQLPSTWKPFDASSSRFDYGMGTSLGQPFLLVSRVPQATGSPAERKAFLARIGAVIDDETTTSVDGHDATIIRYRLPISRSAGVLSHIASVDVEYDIDLGNGDIAIIAFGVGSNPDAADLIRWMRSTIHITR